MNQLGQLEAAINKGVQYLEQHQYPNGEFCCYIAADEPMQGWCITDSTVFATMVVASCLLPLNERPEVDAMITRATDYIAGQMHRGGVWPVFSERHPWHHMVPYDADSLAYASALLEARGVRCFEESNVPLLLANRSQQGLFYTWFILRPRWHTNRTHWRLAIKEISQPITSFFFWRANECTRADIDLGINTNIVYYLGETEQTRPVIVALIQTIAEGREGNCDKWYRNPYNMYYLLSRAYKRGVVSLEPVIQPIVERIVAGVQPDGRIGKSVLDTAFAISTLLNFGADVPPLTNAVSYLIAKQGEAGEWPRWLFYYGGPKLLQGWGSEELTTGFCLEALAGYRQKKQLLA
ncbi:hypothetical protein M0L20_05405 [Spirosoma sp. RP8]|uniref:Uncharacterized protein n=1 Tax=Spirosoma liriopis TaxID=2937440 RepID=A0ABT0HGL2_9BACT|nr:hypothetical protein [Spirosoma liriopis]MCK8491280.1 hypothetical protein [Spirosoma liriopis]